MQNEVTEEECILMSKGITPELVSFFVHSQQNIYHGAFNRIVEVFFLGLNLDAIFQYSSVETCFSLKVA